MTATTVIDRTPYRQRRRPPIRLVREAAAGYDAVNGGDVGAQGPAWWSPGALDTAVDEVARLDLAEYGIRELQTLLRQIDVPLKRLEAARSRITETLRQRQVAAAPPGRERQAEQAAQRFLTEQLRMSPADAKRTAKTGERLADAPETGAKYAEGAISQAHAAVIADTLRHLPEADRAAVEAELLELAQQMHPVQLGKVARRRIAEADLATGERLAARRNARRRASWSDTADGALRISAELYGTGAEIVREALTAATPAPTAEDTRSHAHRRADALIELCALSLRAAELPAVHGVRPHVNVTVDLDTLLARAGLATLGSGESIPLTELRELLADCDVTRFILAPDGRPLEASEVTRTVPVAVARAVKQRDRTCTWHHCDRPAPWCHIAHGDVPFAAGGHLTIDDCALLCPEHHRRYDAGGWKMTITGSRVAYHRDPTRLSATEIAARARAARPQRDRPRQDGPHRDRAGHGGTHPPPPPEPRPPRGQNTGSSPATARPMTIEGLDPG